MLALRICFQGFYLSWLVLSIDFLKVLSRLVRVASLTLRLLINYWFRYFGIEALSFLRLKYPILKLNCLDQDFVNGSLNFPRLVNLILIPMLGFFYQRHGNRLLALCFHFDNLIVTLISQHFLLLISNFGPSIILRVIQELYNLPCLRSGQFHFTPYLHEFK